MRPAIARLAVALLAPLLGCAFSDGRGRARGAETALENGARTYLAEGDTDAAERHLALAAEAGCAGAAFLLGDLLDGTGRPEEALPFYVEALERAGDRGTFEAEAEAAAMALVAIRGRVRDPAVKLGTLADRLAERGARLPAGAWFHLRNLAFAFDRLAGRSAALPERLRATGCLTRFELVGPLGPRTWDAFDEPQGAAPDPAWARRDRVEASTCSVRAFPGTRPEPGAFRARTTIFLERPAEVRLRLETSAAARVRIGSTVVHESDTRQGWLPTVRWFSVRLPAGTASIAVDLASPHSAPFFSLAALAADGRPAVAAHDPAWPDTVLAVPAPGPEPDGGDPGLATARGLARLRVALWRGDFQWAGAMLETSTEPSPVLLAARAEVAMNDPSRPGEGGFEEGLRLLEDALAAEPRLWQARSHLARQWAADDRAAEAMSLLLAGLDLTPDEPGLHGRFAELAAELDWPAELARGVAALERLRPGSCETLAWRMALARRAGDEAAALDLARRISRCDAGSTDLADALERAQRFGEALEERRRLGRSDPDRASLALDEALTAAAAGESVALADAARRAIAAAPTAGDARFLLADALLAAGDPERAGELLALAADTVPGLRPEAGEILAGLEGRAVLAEFRVDGPALVAHYLRLAPRYETAAVWVLDRAVNIVAEDGSRTELVHTIAHLKTAEAVEDHGEQGLPPGARLLTARTIKADGRILEPERVAQKDTASLPDLEPGDFVESEYLSHIPPSPLFPGGFDTGRFSFQDFTTAFHRSEIVLIVPAGMAIAVDRRGDAPEPVERRLGGRRALTWRVRGRLPRALEPLAPSAEEYLPSVRVVAGDGPAALPARLGDMLADGARRGARLEAAAREIVRGIDPADSGALHRAVYRFAMDDIEESGDLFEQPGHIVERRSGSRVRALLGLLGALGLEARLALVRPADGDDTPAAATAPGLVDRKAVLLPGAGWISLEQEGAPFGWLPPDLRHRPAVLVDDGAATRTDGGSVPVDTQLVELEVELGADGSARGRVVERLRGSLAAGWRVDLRRLPAGTRAERFQEGYLSTAIPGSRLLALEVRGLDDPEADLELEYAFEAPVFARRESGTLAAELPFDITLVRKLGGLAERTTPVVLSSRIAKTVHAVIALPAGHAAEVSSAPNAAGEWGSVTRRIAIENGRLVADIEAALDAGRVPPEHYARLLDFARAADLASRVVLIVRPEGGPNPRGGLPTRPAIRKPE